MTFTPLGRASTDGDRLDAFVNSDTEALWFGSVRRVGPSGGTRRCAELGAFVRARLGARRRGRQIFTERSGVTGTRQRNWRSVAVLALVAALAVGGITAMIGNRRAVDTLATSVTTSAPVAPSVTAEEAVTVETPIEVVEVTPPSTPPSTPAADPFAPVGSPDVGDYCADDLTAEGMTDFFAGTIGTFEGADYQRSFKLPDGRVLWVFQDAFISGTLVHNAGMIQSGRCFTMLNNGARSWLLGPETTHMQQWHWILDGGASTDGTEFNLYVAEMTARTDSFLGGKVDVTALNRAVLDADTLGVKRIVPEAIEGLDLYGWSVTSDADFTYLYSHCHLQFGHSAMGAHECAIDAKVARVPLGDFDAAKTYWDGAIWNADPASAINIVDGLFIVPTGYGLLPSHHNPVNVRFDGERFRLISNPGDWWGSMIFTAVSETPAGPWVITSATEMARPAKCEGAIDCSTYFASWVPWMDNGDHIWGIGHNTWDTATADELWVYRPTFYRAH